MSPSCRTVYFDKSCPLCAAEIGHYERLATPGAVKFVDVSAPAADLGSDLQQSMAMARFHVRDERGALYSGAAAFVQLWSALQGWRHIARVARVPSVLWVLEGLYRAFLPVRPVLSRAVRLVTRKQSRSRS
jgi:predicted DCC family thiol-disulfide oxidoreductase YuxK